jgi:hypothetical protein
MVGSVVWISRCADQQSVAQAVAVVVERQFAVAITCVELHSKHQAIDVYEHTVTTCFCNLQINIECVCANRTLM